MKTFLKLAAVTTLVVIVGWTYVYWRTSISSSVKQAYDLGPSFTFQADDFLIEIPDSYQLTNLAGLLEWPDGFRLDFQEFYFSEAGGIESSYASLKSDDLEEGVERLDLSREIGRSSIMISRPPYQARKKHELSLLVKFHNGFLLIKAEPLKSVAGRSVEESSVENKRLFILSVKEFMESYYWLGSHQGRPETGVFRTRLGLISKKSSDSFRYWPLKASFWSNEVGQSFEILTSRMSGENFDLCSLGRFKRFQEQWAGRASYRSNCRPLQVGGRRGLELLALQGSDLEKNAYRLIWEPDHDGVRGDELRLLFYTGSPMRSVDPDKIPETSDSVISRWRAMLATVRFF